LVKSNKLDYLYITDNPNLWKKHKRKSNN
jgi:hypothetical protein